MKYWVAYDDRERRDKIVAFHEDRDVVKEYIDSVLDTTYKLGRCKSSELKKIKDVEGLYLVKHLDTYVQCKFYEFLNDIAESEIYELKNAAGTLERILRLNDPGNSTRKAIIKTIAYLKGLILDEEETVPDYESTQREYNEFEFQREKVAWGDTLDFEDTNRYLMDNGTFDES